MTNRKTAAYCVLLAVFITIGALCISTGESQARYSNTISCSTVFETAEAEITSNILVKKGEAPVTVLLGEIEDEETVRFRVKASGAQAKKNISWSVDSEYVLVEVGIGEEKIDSGAEITISGEEETEIVMTITNPEGTSGKAAANINLSVGELCGTFKAEFPKGESTAGGNAESTETPSEGEGENTGGDPTFEEIPGEGGEGNTEQTEGGEETLENAEAVEIKTVPCFDPKGMLPIRIDLPDATRTVKVGFYENDEMVPLPEGTKISTNEGTDFYTVYGAGIAELAAEKFLVTESGNSLLLDFGKAELGGAEKITVAVSAYSAEGFIGTYTVSSAPTVSGAGKTEVDSAVENLEVGERSADAETKECFVLSAGDALSVKLPKEWIEESEASLQYSILILTAGGNEPLVYDEVAIDGSSLSAGYTVGDEYCELRIETGEILPAAGTYQVYIRLAFDEICFYKEQITFFINYSTDIYSTLGS